MSVRGPTRSREKYARRAILILIGLWLVFQIAMPMRHHLYPGDTSWTEQGHRFAWQMKLRDKRSQAQFVVRDAASGEVWQVDEFRYLTHRQYVKMTSRPDMILQFAHHLADLARRNGVAEPQVYVTALSSLNGREPDMLIDPSVDLAAQPRNLMPADWIMPLLAELP